MDTSVLKPDTKYGSVNQLKFVKKASIREICAKYASFRTHRANSTMHESIVALKDILDQLECIGIVYSSYDEELDWHSFFDANKIIIEECLENQNKQHETFDLSDPLSVKLMTSLKYVQILKSAMRRGFNFDLDMEYIEKLLKEKRCFYTNVVFDGVTNKLTFDRIDNSKGYVKGNVVACSERINFIKNNLLESENCLFDDIDSLKRFVDNVYVAIKGEYDPLEELRIK